jgi:hypothetical protein
MLNFYCATCFDPLNNLLDHKSVGIMKIIQQITLRQLNLGEKSPEIIKFVRHQNYILSGKKYLQVQLIDLENNYYRYRFNEIILFLLV